MAKKLFSDSEIERLRKLFQEFDKDGSGNISLDEAEKSINKFGIKVPDQQVVIALFKRVDTNKNGTIEFVEFLKFAGFAKEIEVEKVKSRSFELAPSDSDSTSLAVVVEPNSDAAGNVDIYGTLPLTLRNRLALTSPVRPFSFVLKEALTSGTYKLQLISQLYAPAWGRWAGLVTPANVNLKEYHILGDNALDHDIVQISILGVKSGGKWRHKKADYVEPAGRVELVLEYQSDAGTLLASWNGYTLPFGVKNIPQGQQRFTFELPNTLELTIQSLVKVSTPTLQPPEHFDFYSY